MVSDIFRDGAHFATVASRVCLHIRDGWYMSIGTEVGTHCGLFNHQFRASRIFQPNQSLRIPLFFFLPVPFLFLPSIHSASDLCYSSSVYMTSGLSLTVWEECVQNIHYLGTGGNKVGFPRELRSVSADNPLHPANVRSRLTSSPCCRGHISTLSTGSRASRPRSDYNGPLP